MNQPDLKDLVKEAKDLAAFLYTLRGPSDQGTIKAQDLAKKLDEHHRKYSQ